MFLRVFMLTAVALMSASCIDKTKESVDVVAPPPCPEVGHATVLCPDLQVKLLALKFHRAIGKDSVVSAREESVFCLVELEWPKLPAEHERKLPTLVDGAGTSWPIHPAAERAWRAMQPDGGDPSKRPPVAAGDRETVIFELALSAAREGLQLRFAPPCEEPLESAHFCLGRHQIVME